MTQCADINIINKRLIIDTVIGGENRYKGRLKLDSPNKSLIIDLQAEDVGQGNQEKEDWKVGVGSGQ